LDLSIRLAKVISPFVIYLPLPVQLPLKNESHKKMEHPGWKSARNPQKLTKISQPGCPFQHGIVRINHELSAIKKSNRRANHCRFGQMRKKEQPVVKFRHNRGFDSRVVDRSFGML
jgi:hypothetical protein